MFNIDSHNNAVDIHKEALKRAWDNRNFEIDKFWQRSTFFLGFIALIFAGYFSVSASEAAREMFLDFYLILLGGIFSYGWILAIRGSKQWQENWEAHIGKLEDKITGPLYKIVYYSGKPFYSVSKINKILAWIIFICWVLLFVQYVVSCMINIFCDRFESPTNIPRFIFPGIAIAGAIAGIIVLQKRGRSSTNGFESEKEKDYFFYWKEPQG